MSAVKVVCTACLLSCAYVGCKSMGEMRVMEYTVDLTHSQEGEVHIGLNIREMGEDEVRLRGFLQKDLMSMTEFRAFDGNGVRLNVRDVRQEDPDDPYNVVVQKSIDAKGAKALRISYTVRPGQPLGLGYGCVETKPVKRFGYVGGDFAQLSGKNLFLLPETDIGTIRVRFELSPGWETITTWHEIRDGWWYPGIKGKFAREELVNASLGLGRFERQQQRIGDTEVEVAVYAGWDDGMKSELYANALSIYRYATQIFGQSPGPKYAAIFTPIHDATTEYWPLAWSSGQALGMEPPTRSRWLGFAREVFNKWVKYPPYRMEYEDAEDFWLVDSVPMYYAVQILNEIGILEKDGQWAEFQDYYLGLKGNLEVNLSRRYGTHPPYREFDAIIKGALMVKYLDAQLQDRTQGRMGLDRVMAYEYGKRQGLQFKEDMEELSGADFTDVFRDYVQTSNKLVLPGAAAPVYKELVGKPANYHKPADRPTDELTFVVSGNTYGYLENCGCRLNASGGLARLATLVDKTRKSSADVAVVSTGNVFPLILWLAVMDDATERELATYLRGMEAMGYDVSGISSNEINHGLDLFARITRNATFPFVTANLRRDDRPLAPPYTTKKMGRHNVAFLGLTQRHNLDAVPPLYEVSTFGLHFEDPFASFMQYLPELAAHHDVLVLIGKIGDSLIRRIVNYTDEVDLIMTTEHKPSSGGDNSLDEIFVGNTMILYSQLDSYGVAKVDVQVDRDGRITDGQVRYVFLDDRIPDDPTVRSIVKKFYASAVSARQEQRIGGPSALNESTGHTGGEFAGVQTCASCHAGQYEQWKATGHATAYNRLLNKHRYYKAECMGCHTTGVSDLGEFITTPRNFIDRFGGIQCEVCHGPAGDHVTQPIRTNIIRKPTEAVCVNCHTPRRSIAFSYPERYTFIAH